MSVITQEYDIDLKATGWYPVVEMSQFDTGSRTIVLTVHDGKELVPLDDCVARIDGRRSDGVEFSASCTVGTGSRVSFTISQEMTRAAGKHVAELVIIDSAGNTVGTQNFILAVEPASMLRDAAASADDRTLYDQYTSSIEAKFNSLSKDVNRTVEDISQAIGATSKPKTIINQRCLVDNAWSFNVHLTYDPTTALCVLRVNSRGGVSGVSTTDTVSKTVMQIPADYLPDASLIDSVDGYVLSSDQMQPEGTGRSDTRTEYALDAAGNLIYRIDLPSGDAQLSYSGDCEASWYARGGKYMGVETIGTGGNTIKVGTVTTGDAGTQASVTNSGTAKDVVLDFTIPRGDKGDTGGTIPVASADTLGGIKVGSNLTIADDGTLSAAGGASGGFDPTTVSDIVIGEGATLTNANGKGDIVIGKNAKGAANINSTANSDSIAIGEVANAHGLYSCAVGRGAEAVYKSTAIGAAKATGSNGNIGIGSEAIGCAAKATAYASVALGSKSEATETYTVSVGGPKVMRRIVNVATPTAANDAATKAYVDSKVTSGGGYDPTTVDSPLIGTNATAGTNAIHVVAVGAKASADWTNSTALGFSASAAGNNAIAIGSPASASYQDAIAIGAQTKATKEDAIAIGSWATATNTDSVAIGFESATDADSTVSVGSATSGKTRRITNVGTPTGDNDAATKAYVDALEAKLTALTARVAALEAK